MSVQNSAEYQAALELLELLDSKGKYANTRSNLSTVDRFISHIDTLIQPQQSSVNNSESELNSTVDSVSSECTSSVISINTSTDSIDSQGTIVISSDSQALDSSTVSEPTTNYSTLDSSFSSTLDSSVVSNASTLIE